jgi:hypothetical protein
MCARHREEEEKKNYKFLSVNYNNIFIHACPFVPRYRRRRRRRHRRRRLYRSRIIIYCNII